MRDDGAWLHAAADRGRVTAKALVTMVLALTACSGPGDSGKAQCERQASQDPAVQTIYARSNGYYTVSGTKQQADLVEATRQAVLRCMRAKGLAPPGGVQPVAPRIY